MLSFYRILLAVLIVAASAWFIPFIYDYGQTMGDTYTRYFRGETWSGGNVGISVHAFVIGLMAMLSGIFFFVLSFVSPKMVKKESELSFLRETEGRTACMVASVFFLTFVLGNLVGGGGALLWYGFISIFALFIFLAVTVMLLYPLTQVLQNSFSCAKTTDEAESTAPPRSGSGTSE